MTEFVVHTVPGSPFARAVLATLIEKNAPHKVARIALGGLKTEPHLSRHPFGRMPVLEHDGFMLYETQAILRYIDRVLPQPALTPADPRAAARMDQVLNICDWYLFQGVNSVIGFQRVVGPRLMGLKTDEAAIAEAMPKAHTVFGELSRLLGTNACFAGPDPSLADLHVAAQMAFLAETPEWAPLTRNASNLVMWFDRMNARPSMKATTWEQVEELAKAA